MQAQDRLTDHSEQKRRLVADDDATPGAFSARVSDLNRQIGTRAVDEARVKWEQARLALEAHGAEHGR